MSNLRRTAVAAAIALSVGLAVIVIGEGFSTSFPLRLVEAAGIVVVAIVAFAALVVAVASRLADWREPSSEEEFEKVVRRSERLAREGLGAEPGEDEFM